MFVRVLLCVCVCVQITDSTSNVFTSIFAWVVDLQPPSVKIVTDLVQGTLSRRANFNLTALDAYPVDIFVWSLDDSDWVTHHATELTYGGEGLVTLTGLSVGQHTFRAFAQVWPHEPVRW